MQHLVSLLSQPFHECGRDEWRFSLTEFDKFVAEWAKECPALRDPTRGNAFELTAEELAMKDVVFRKRYKIPEPIGVEWTSQDTFKVFPMTKITLPEMTLSQTVKRVPFKLEDQLTVSSSTNGTLGTMQWYVPDGSPVPVPAVRPKKLPSWWIFPYPCPEDLLE